MGAHDFILDLIIKYFVSLGFDKYLSEQYFSPRNFKELLSIRLANANIVIKNKTDRSSHQTHIAITGEAINLFFTSVEFSSILASQILKINVCASNANIAQLRNQSYEIDNSKEILFEYGSVTAGKRTQGQLQLSKRSSDNSQFFNDLRSNLYESDLLLLLKFRGSNCILAIGIPQVFYLDIIPDYAERFETNTYLILPYSPTAKLSDIVKVINSLPEALVSKKNKELLTDEMYQLNVLNTIPSTTTYKMVVQSENSLINPCLAHEAALLANYLCEWNTDHITFVTNNGIPYIETHHLIPLNFQTDFEYSLDVKANIISLCPRCHRLMHFGTIDDIIPMLEFFLKTRINLLNKCGINISLEKLIIYYN